MLDGAKQARIDRNVSSTKDVSDERIAACFLDLESDSYLERERACRILRKAGMKVVPELANRILFGKPESASRCGMLLTEIALNSNEADMTRVGRVLNLLAKNGCEHLGHTAFEIQNLWKKQQVVKNVKKLESAGFGISASKSLSFDLDVITSENNFGRQKRISPGVQRLVKKLELEEQITAIVKDTDGVSFERFTAEVLAEAKLNDRTNLHGNDSFDHMELAQVYEGGILSNRFEISIDQATRLDETTIDSLLLLPINSIVVTGRKLDAQTLDAFTKMPNLYSVSFIECQYELKDMFDWVASMPNTSIGATGNKAFLGVQTQVAAFNGEAYECLIEAVVEDTAAEVAGLRIGDVIETVSGTKIRGHNELVLAIGTFKPGQKADLAIRRDGEIIHKEVQFKERPAGQ